MFNKHFIYDSFLLPQNTDNLEVKMIRKLLSLLIAFSLTGCASIAYDGTFQKSGQYDPITSLAVTKSANDMKWADAHDIEVYFVEPPKGISIENNRVTYDDIIWQSLGTVEIEPSTLNFFGKYAEDEDWKNIYCPINGVLAYATLFLWNITPFPWTCTRFAGSSFEAIEERKVRMANTMRKVAKAAGGEVVVVTKVGDLQYFDTESKIIISTEKTVFAKGAIFKRKLNSTQAEGSI